MGGSTEGVRFWNGSFGLSTGPNSSPNTLFVQNTQIGTGSRPAQSNVVWRRIHERVEQRISTIELGIAALLEGGLGPADASNVRAEASLLSDWFFALDLVVAGRLARDISNAFRLAVSPSAASNIANQVQQLRGLLRVAEAEWTEVKPDGRRVHIISAADAQIDAVAWHLQQNGVDVTVSPTFFSAPDNADMVLVLSNHPSDALNLLSTIRERSPKTTRALVVPSGTEANELLNVTSSVQLMLRHDDPPIEVANEILITLRPTRSALSSVVLYGANEMYSPLVDVGLSAHIVAAPHRVLQALGSGNYKMVVIGPEADHRARLVHLLRSTSATRSSLIVVTSAGEAEHRACQAAGADIIVPKGDLSRGWAEQLRALAVARDLDSGIIADESMPVTTGQRAWVHIDRCLQEIERGGGHATLMLLQIPRDSSPEERLRITNVLSDEFRQDDAVGAISDHAFVVVLRGASMEQAATRVERTLINLAIPSAPGTISLASFPDDNLGVKGLIDACSRASLRAVESDGPVVVRSDWSPGQSERLDVLVVESDPTLSRLLEQLIEREGLSVRVLPTGSAALNTLTGPEAIVPPRLILLELDAMGANGMMILRSLRRSSVLERSEVVVTCSLVNDGQLREAFELGAVDMVVKPFSSVVLRNRISRVLEN